MTTHRDHEDRIRREPAIKLFVSFDPASRPEALWLRRRLQAFGHVVALEDDSGPRSPLNDISRAIGGSDLLIAIVTPAYALSGSSHRAVKLAQDIGKPVIAVFTGLASGSALAGSYSAFPKIELEEAWDGSEQQRQRVAEQIEDMLRARQRQLAEGDRHELDAGSAHRLTRGVLLYDLEDQAIGHQILRVKPGWRRSLPGSATAAEQARLPHILLWTAATSEPYSLVRREFERAAEHAPAFMLSTQRIGRAPEGALVLDVADIIAGTAGRQARSRLTDDDARHHVSFLLSQAHRINHDCPLDVLNDRICCSSEVGDLVREAYHLAEAELHESEALRLKAAYRYALVLRFYGDWRHAVEIIGAKLAATHGELPEESELIRLRLALEKLALEYELGDHKAVGIQADIKKLQMDFRRLDDLVGYVQASRMLGNVLRARGEFQNAERVIERTIGVAEYLAESESGSDPSLLLVADCYRELAGLHIARHDPRLATEALAEARKYVAPQDPVKPAARYLSAILDYVGATLAQGDEPTVRATAPIEQAQAALSTLLLFENPIRIAQVYSWLGLAWARQIPKRQEDLRRGEEYLKKALRIREGHRQQYTRGLSHLSLGELYEATGDFDLAVDHYQRSRQIFNARGLPPALARAHAALARAYARKSTAAGDDAAELAQQQLRLAEQRYNEVGLANEALELRYELQHGGRRPLAQVGDDTPLIAVGEYLLHEWIREQTESLAVPMTEGLQLIAGVGDDAAVLGRSSPKADWSFVLTTDSAPGSLAALDRPPEYVGRFAVVQTVADVLAMGARPVALLANVFLNRAVSTGYVRRVITAMLTEAARYGVAVIGGDIKERNEQSIGCVGIGVIENKRILRRSAARPGQDLCVTLASAPDGGTRLIGARWARELVEYYRLDASRTVAEFPELESVFDPGIKSDLLYVPDQVMRYATGTGALRSAIDTSDGVLACLEILARESGVSFELDQAAIDRLIDPRARLLAQALGLPPAAFLFNAGHDWEIVFTCESGQFAAVQEAVRRALGGNGAVARIGTVVAAGAEGAGVITLCRTDGKPIIVPYYTDEKFVPRSYQDRPSQWLSFANRLRAAAEPGT